MFGFGRKRTAKDSISEEDLVGVFMHMLQTIAKMYQHSDSQLEEFLLQWFIIDFSTNARLGQDSAFKNRLLSRFYEEATRWFVNDLHGESGLIEQRIGEYGIAYHEETFDKEGKPQGPAWSIGKVYARAIDGSVDIALVTKGSMTWTQQQESLSKVLTDLGY